MKNLELGRDYINGNGLIVIDRLGDYGNRGFDENNFEYDLFCSCLYVWREATKEEVIEAFEKHLVYRFGKDWRTMKIKGRHPASLAKINGGLWNVGIAKEEGSWKVWNKNGLLYCDGIWVERLEEFEKIHIKDAIKENTVVHCETEEEAERILGMAHELGYKWGSGGSYKGGYNNWSIHRSATCYYLFEGMYARYEHWKHKNFAIISSTQIANLEPIKLSDWSFSHACEKADNRYALKRDVLTILSVESKLNPDKKISEYLEQFKLILEVL